LVAIIKPLSAIFRKKIAKINHSLVIDKKDLNKTIKEIYPDEKQITSNVEFCTLANFDANAQVNLIPNPSFEEYNTCICDFNNNVKEWYIAYDSPDYFNECISLANYCNVPENFTGYNYAFDGKAYIGAGQWFLTGNTREVFYTRIKEDLKKGKKYCLSFYVARSNQSAYYCNNIGALFSDKEINFSIDSLNLYQPQITNKDQTLSEFGKWYNIVGDYVADGTEKYLYFGNFKTSTESDCKKTLNTDTLLYSNGLYTYFDLVELFECKDVFNELSNVFTPNGDGVNDYWEFNVDCPDCEIIIYDRWGNEIIKSKTSNFNFDNCSNNAS